ncbi:sensor histidine kinase [Rhizobacter sp. LjRoot28]|uniref:sensor histidine kinase n=1 Tax=Rhizobacter sp. LjRoot28 TaxID=3342309 RepID=UPI003ECD8510
MSDDLESLLASAETHATTDVALARRLLRHAISTARMQADDRVLPHCLHRAAVLLLRWHDACGAYALCIEGQPLLERLDDRWGATQVLKLRGRCCLEVGEHELAETLLSEARDRFERMGLATEAARCESLLASAYRGEGNLLAAVHFAGHARARLDPAPTHLLHRLGAGEAYSRLLLARRLKSVGESDGAQQQLDAAAAVLPDPAEVDDASNGQAALVHDISAMVAAERGDGPRQRAALARLLRIARRLNAPDWLGLAWLRLSELRASQGRVAATITGARSAVRQLARTAGVARLAAAERLLADALERHGDSQGAYEAFASALRHDAEQERVQVAVRLELLALHARAEQDLRDTEQTLAYAQRFSNVGYLVASVNHELNQPLASIRLLAETTIELAAHGHADEVRESLRSMHQLGERLEVVASKLAAFPVRENAPLRPVALGRVVDVALELLQARLAQIPCEVHRLREDVWAEADEAQVIHVVVNLVNNAIDALAAQPHRRIDFSCTLGARQVKLTVQDNGPGLPPAVHDRLFHPFFSTKAAGQGLGLGLALSRDALRAMGGDLTARTGPGTGAAFDITLPLAAAPHPPSP